ncbi:hypothetical protein [Geminicoccus sp.]|uniref:hypothetical protein n=1 Tax=Geminicoccus sp. TaxID=2024832 RepID=UPI0039C8A9FC
MRHADRAQRATAARNRVLGSLPGSKEAETWSGSGGDDLARGGRGHDLLVFDILDAGAGQDLFHGGSGRDTLELHLSRKVANASDFKAEFARFEAVIEKGADYSFQFKMPGLVVQKWRMSTWSWGWLFSPGEADRPARCAPCGRAGPGRRASS